MVRGLAQAMWIGALYGATTFLPVSRSGHLALSGMLFDSEVGSAALEQAFLLGTLIATVALTWQSVIRLVRASVGALRRPTTLLTTHEGRDLVTILLAQFPVAVFWLLFAEQREPLSQRPLLVAVGLFVTTMVLLSTAWSGRGERIQPTWGQALLMGACQGVAWVPGLSFSGCTVVLGMWFGLTARRSFELALLLSIPTILVAMARLRTSAFPSDVSIPVATVGVIVALLSGLLAGKLLKVSVVRGQVAWFAMWVAPLAVATFAFARAWPGH